jgi:hypothetical protein
MQKPTCESPLKSFKKGRKEVRLFESATQLPAPWDATLPAGHSLQSARLRLLESAQLQSVSYRYAALFAGENIIACASFQVLHLQDSHVAPMGLPSAQYALWKIFRRVFRPKLLVAGHLFRHDTAAFWVAPNLTPHEGFRAYQQLVQRAARSTRAQAVLLKDAAPELRDYLQHFAPQYQLLRGDVSMELALPAAWGNMTDYEKALKHKYAQRFRNIRKAGSALRVVALSTEEVEAQSGRIYELYLQVAQAQRVRLGFLSPDFLPLLKKGYPEELSVWGFYEGEELVAFSSAWQKEEALDMFYIGFDYERNRDLQLYFNILFFAVETGIRRQVGKIIFGRTALEAKARLGARAAYLYTFVYLRFLPARALFRRLQPALSAGDTEWESRHPFKEPPPTT